MSEKRVKFYQITNNVTDDVYVGATPQALYKRLYIHKTDTTKGSPSRLRALMQKIGKDKFKIELLEEGVFANADAINARELFWMREKGSTLNEGYTKATTEVKEELKEYMLHIQELQHKVQMLEAQLKTVQTQTQIDMNTTTSTRASSVTCPETFNIWR
jgi:group I intron endonuclease